MTDKLTVDNSILTTTEKCSLNAVMEYVLHLRTKAPKDAAHVGNAFHKGLEWHFKGYDVERCLSEFKREYYALLGESPVVEERLGYTNCETILGEWLRRHPLDKLPFVADPALVETGVIVELDEGGEFDFFAKIDAPVRAREDNTLWPMDNKTRSWINAWWIKKFRMGSQMTGYIWTLGKKFEEIVPGAFINAIQVDLLPSSERKCKKHGVKFSECSRMHMVSQLLMITRLPEVVEQWHRNAIAAARKFRVLKQVYPSVEYIPAVPQEGQFSEACTFCEFKDFCAAGKPLSWVESEFVYTKWEPWNVA